jgi:2'-5' RNA ligase
VTRHALLVPFPELYELVDPWLERTCATKPSHGISAHVTLLYPAPDDEDGIARVVGGFDAFDVEFREFGRFADVLYLAPDPAPTFVEITRALVQRFPQWPPYGGAYEEVVPHLTVAQTTSLDEAEAVLRPRLPLRGRARAAVLYAQNATSQWDRRARFPFGED